MMKSAILQKDITESVGKAETDVYPAETHFPSEHTEWIFSSLVRQGTVIRQKSVGFLPKTGWYRGVHCVSSWLWDEAFYFL